MNYIGSKCSMIDKIKEVIEKNIEKPGSALDVFSGTGAVSQLLKNMGYQVYANDMQSYSFAMLKALLSYNEYPTFDKLVKQLELDTSQELELPTYSPLEKKRETSNRPAFHVLKHLENLPEKEGKFYHEYCEGGEKGRMYFSESNGKKIQAARDRVEEWLREGLIDGTECVWLIACILESADKVANTASVYAAHLKHVKKSAQKTLRFVAVRPTEGRVDGKRHGVMRGEATEIVEKFNLPKMVLTYLDPPYNQRQYGTNYHILETIARWDIEKFEPRGKTGLRPKDETTSAFCSKQRAREAYEELFKSLNSEYVLMSYSEDGILTKTQITLLFAEFCKEFDFMEFDRHRFSSDKTPTKVYKSNEVKEYLIFGRMRDV